MSVWSCAAQCPRFSESDSGGVMFASLLAIDEPLTSVGTNDP